MAEAAGCGFRSGAPGTLDLQNASGFDAVAWFGGEAELKSIRVAMSQREGALLPTLTSSDQVGRLQLERHVCIDTTAAGGNATLMASAV